MKYYALTNGNRSAYNIESIIVYNYACKNSQIFCIYIQLL
jgi:hypothetical protein